METTTEQLLNHLRQAEKNWLTARWGYLLVSVLPLLGNIVVIWKYHDLIQLFDNVFREKSLEAGFYLTIAVSAALIAASFGALGLVFVIQNWRGNRARQLLILTTERELQRK